MMMIMMMMMMMVMMILFCERPLIRPPRASRRFWASSCRGSGGRCLPCRSPSCRWRSKRSPAQCPPRGWSPREAEAGWQVMVVMMMVVMLMLVMLMLVRPGQLNLLSSPVPVGDSNIPSLPCSRHKKRDLEQKWGIGQRKQHYNSSISRSCIFKEDEQVYFMKSSWMS